MRRYFSCLLPSDLLVGFEMDPSTQEAEDACAERTRFAAASTRRKHVKKQHQAGWGEGDEGEERLGQFYRLKARGKGDEIARRRSCGSSKANISFTTSLSCLEAFSLTL